VTEPTADPAVSLLVENEAAAQDRVADNLVTAIMLLWSGFTAFYVGDAVAAFGQRVAQLVAAAQRSAATITEAHLRQQMARMNYRLPATPIIDLPPDLRRGAETADVYQRPVREVRYLVSTEVPLAEAVRSATERLEKIVRTDLQLARVVASQQVHYAADEQVRGYRRVIHPELGAVCGLCIAASDRVYSKREMLPLHPGCVLEGTEVVASDVRALTRRRYAGPVVILCTGSGQELRVTPNHPVLTEQGWVRADGLRQGDRVLRHNGLQRIGRRSPDEQQRPARVEDVWRSLTVEQGLLSRSVPLAAEDFHGDVAGESEVDVVLVDGHLAPVGDVSFVQPHRELSLVGAHGGRVGLSAVSALDLFFMGLDTSPRGFVSALQEFKALLRAESFVAQASSLTSTSHRNFSAPETAGDGGAGYAEVGRELLDRLAGQVEFDDLVEVDVVAWSGHVYNLETGEGWYDASSIVVSNCKCTTISIIGARDPGSRLNADDLATIYAAAGGTTESRALAGTRFTIKTNGELGPILVPEGVDMKGPAQARRQLSPRAAEMRKVQLERQIAELKARPRLSGWHQDRLEQLEELLDRA